MEDAFVFHSPSSRQRKKPNTLYMVIEVIAAVKPNGGPSQHGTVIEEPSWQSYRTCYFIGIATKHHCRSAAFDVSS